MKNKNKIVYIIYILVLLSSFYSFYNLNDGDEIGFTVLYFYILFPILTFLISYDLSKRIKSRLKVFLSILLSLLYNCPFFILLFKTDISFISFVKSYYDLLFFPFIISLFGLILGDKYNFGESILYTILKPFIKLYIFFLHPKYEGLENININKKDKVLYAGNHTNIKDPLLLISSSKRNIHFLSKIELFRFPYGILFNNLGLIPVDRSKKDRRSLDMAREYLENNKVVAIFPEGTIPKDKKLLPFKYGAVKLAKDTGASIIPFAITGDFKLFSHNLKIKFGKEIKIKNDLEYENNRLRDIIDNMIKEG